MRFYPFAAVLVAAFFCFGCDSGRVIDAEERKRVLYPASASGKKMPVVIAEASTAPTTEHGHYYFTLFDESDPYELERIHTIRFNSLLQLNSGRTPSMEIDGGTHEFKCETNQEVEACGRWMNEFNIQELSSKLPSLTLTTTLSRLTRYALKSRVGADPFQSVATYETFRITFAVGDRDFYWLIAKQEFVKPTPLAPLLWSRGTSDEERPFLDLIYARLYVPIPSYEEFLFYNSNRKVDGREIRVLSGMENVRDKQRSTIEYVFEKL